MAIFTLGSPCGPQHIYRLNLLYYFLIVCPRSTFCAALCFYLSASCYLLSTHQHSFNSLWDYLQRCKEHKFTFPQKYTRDLTTLQNTKTGFIQKGFEKVKFCEYPLFNYVMFSCACTLFVFILSAYTNKWVCRYYLWDSKSYVQQHKIHTNEQKSITDLYVQPKQK